LNPRTIWAPTFFPCREISHLLGDACFTGVAGADKQADRQKFAFIVQGNPVFAGGVVAAEQSFLRVRQPAVNQSGNLTIGQNRREDGRIICRQIFQGETTAVAAKHKESTVGLGAQSERMRLDKSLPPKTSDHLRDAFGRRRSRIATAIQLVERRGPINASLVPIDVALPFAWLISSGKTVTLDSDMENLKIDIGNQNTCFRPRN
jgi:hypothetical protein